jgi:hypothetical protein
VHRHQKLIASSVGTNSKARGSARGLFAVRSFAAPIGVCAADGSFCARLRTRNHFSRLGL